MSLLKFFHRFTHNWGLAIVLLTLFIKLLTFYPTQKSLVSAKKMQKLAPKMAAIRKKYENDRQRQSVETMNLYKAHGVSPFGGCLPSLIQMPIWIALYSTLNYAVELYRAPFFAHIHDLTAKDPYYITPLVMGGVMFAQMKMSPAGADPQQQAMMSIMMPIMFTGFSLFLPSGLAVYMLTSYLFGILQQLYVNYLDRHGKITVTHPRLRRGAIVRRAPPGGVLTFSAVVKLYVDSVDPGEIVACVAAKETSGVTTSAALLAEAARAAGRAPHDLLREICDVAGGPVSVEVAAGADDRDGMLREARAWAAVAANVVVKLPASDAGIEVVRACAAERIRTAVGTCPSPEQALAAARAGAAHVSAPVGRAGGVDGNDVIRKLVALFRTYGVPTEIVAAAIRIPTDVIDAALAGAHAAAAPAAVLRELDAESSRQADGRG